MAPRIVLGLVLVALAGLAAVPTAAASGPPTVYGFSTGDGHFVLVYVQDLFSTDPVTPDSVVFGDTLYLLVSPNGVNGTVHVTSVQNATPRIYSNATFGLDAHNFTVLTFALPSSSAQVPTTLCVDGGCERFDHRTPATLIPSGILNIGGLDLLALSLTVLSAAAAFPAVVAARSITRRVLFSPRFRAWLWAPHFLLGFVLVIALDYQAFDELLGGWTFVLYPVVFGVLFFAWALSLFNVAKPVEVLRPDPQGGHRLLFNRWRVWMGTLPDGRKVLIGVKWRHWLARLFGHFTVVMPARTDGMKRGPAAESALVTWRRDAVRGERVDLRTRRYRSRPNRDTPFDDFVLESTDPRERDPPSHLYWVDSDKWLDVEGPKLSFHRDVLVPAKTGPDGTVRVPATTRRKWAFPHYIDPPAQASLAGLHYVDAPVAALGWIRAERAYKRLEEVRIALNVVRVSLYTLAQDSSDLQVAEVYRLLEREVLPLTDLEAEEEARSKSPTVTAKSASEPTAKDAEASGRATPPSERDMGTGP